MTSLNSTIPATKHIPINKFTNNTLFNLLLIFSGDFLDKENSGCNIDAIRLITDIVILFMTSRMPIYETCGDKYNMAIRGNAE